MKYFALVLSTLLAYTAMSQSLPIDFESDVVTETFVDFDGGVASVIANPQISAGNMSATVAQIVRDGGTIWAGSKIELDENLIFDNLTALRMKVFTSAPVGTTIKFKLEGSGETERDVQTTVTNEWETLTWEFTGTPANFNSLVFMFDFGNIGDGSDRSTFLFDDVEQVFNGTQIDYPVDFEGAGINYTTLDFGGNVSRLATDPVDPNNTVVEAIKTNGAATWAGTTIGTEAGFATDLPFSLTDSKMNVRVWSPTAGTPIRLKVENSDDPTQTCETELRTTVGGEWENLEFDFLNQAPGTELLSIGLDRGWRYNMASIFFNFGTEGAAAGEQTYFFDDVAFGAFLPTSTEDQYLGQIEVYPNPSSDYWTIELDEVIQELQIFDLAGRLVESMTPENNMVRLHNDEMQAGVYLCRILTESGEGAVRLVKD